MKATFISYSHPLTSQSLSTQSHHVISGGLHHDLHQRLTEWYRRSCGRTAVLPSASWSWSPSEVCLAAVCPALATLQGVNEMFWVHLFWISVMLCEHVCFQFGNACKTISLYFMKSCIHAFYFFIKFFSCLFFFICFYWYWVRTSNINMHRNVSNEIGVIIAF